MDADIESAIRALAGLETTAVNDFQWLTRVRANWKMLLEELHTLRNRDFLPKEHTTEIESKGVPERIEQILGLMKDSMTNLFALYPGDDFCISYTVVRAPLSEKTDIPKRNPAEFMKANVEANGGLAGKNPVDVWQEKGLVIYPCPRCSQTLGWGPGCAVCQVYRVGETHIQEMSRLPMGDGK